MMINFLSKDLRKEELYIQIADCLENLERITSVSFDKINQKWNLLNDDLSDIIKRREIVKTKIEQIKKNNNKAIQVFSPFHYPAKKIKDQYKYNSIIELNQYENKSNHLSASQLTNRKSKYFINQPFELFHPDDLNDMLDFSGLDQFFQTERESLNFLQRQKLNKSRIPWNKIKSISSLIIFNSSEVAYIKSDQDSSIYEFKITNKQKRNEEDNELKIGNIAPPKSMTKNDKFDNFEHNPFKYDDQEAPKVLDNLPNDLPDLGGAVAQDIFFKDETFINLQKVKNDLIEETESKKLPSKLFRILSFDQSSTSSIEEAKIANEKITNNELDKESKKIPNPPPLPNLNLLESPTKILEKTSDPVSIPRIIKQQPIAVDDSRANLLDAIRKAAGKPDNSKVKTIKEKKLEERKNRKETVSTDLMSDLKQHLLSRRQAMVGAKFNQKDHKINDRKEDLGNVYNTLTKLIPSPSASSESSENESDNDWQNS